MTRLVPILMLLSLIAFSPAVAAAETVPSILCKESTTWTRPAPAVQARIWNDSRYSGIGPQAWEWRHDFLWAALESASVPYHAANMAGLWTEDVFSPTCGDKKATEWIGVWVLLHRVTSVEVTDSTYTIHVDATGKGFQSILMKRLNPTATLRFVDAKGELLEEIVEGVTPGTPLLRK